MGRTMTVFALRPFHTSAGHVLPARCPSVRRASSSASTTPAAIWPPCARASARAAIHHDRQGRAASVLLLVRNTGRLHPDVATMSHSEALSRLAVGTGGET